MGIKSSYYKIYDLKIDNWGNEVLDKWVYDDFLRDPDYKKKWISLTTICYDEPRDDVYIGIGSFSNELLWKFDRKTREITSCGYEKVAEPFDSKFHRSIERDGDTLYCAAALFHDIDKQFEARGGRLVKYDIPTGKFTFLARPYEPAYVQSIAMDRERQIIYGCGALPEVFWRYDVKTGDSRLIAHLGNCCELGQPHNLAIDHDGNVWGTYGILRAFSYRTGPDSVRIFKYNPDTDKMEFFPQTFPATEAGDKGKPDCMLTGPDGNIYIGTVGGTLARLDPGTMEIKALCRPFPSSCRMAGLAFSPVDGYLYGICGEDYNTRLFAYDTKEEKLLEVWEIAAEDGVKPVRIHHMAFASDGVIYAGENDNNDRTSYLWEISL